jgi:hypothetical protein
MTNIITGPGEYETKDGQVFVIEHTNATHAFGYMIGSEGPRIWLVHTGKECVDPDDSGYDITRKYTPLPKLREGWCAVSLHGFESFPTKEDVIGYIEGWKGTRRYRLSRFREVPQSEWPEK